MVTGATVSVEEYLTTDYSPDCDYVDGEVLERNLGERDHSTLQMVLAAYLFARKEQWGIHVYPEQRVQVSRSRYRVPDICVVAGAIPQEQIFTRPPFICIEILSSGDRMGRMQQRIDDYLNFGVPHVWLLDPQARRAFVCKPGSIIEVKDAVLGASGPEIILPLAELWR
jgi:Uma2 family endonuclease